jgi:hypothetical protein
MRNGNDLKAFDPIEVVGIASIEREIVGDGDGSNHRVVRTGGCLATHVPQGRSHSAEGAGRSVIERQGLEVGLGLLNVSLSSRSLLFGWGDERTNRKLGQSDCGDEWLPRQKFRV